MRRLSRSTSRLIARILLVAIIPLTAVFYALGIQELISQFTFAGLFKATIALTAPLLLYFELVTYARESHTNRPVLNAYKERPTVAVIGCVFLLGCCGLVVTTVLSVTDVIRGGQKPMLNLLVWSTPALFIGILLDERRSCG